MKDEDIINEKQKIIDDIDKQHNEDYKIKTKLEKEITELLRIDFIETVLSKLMVVYSPTYEDFNIINLEQNNHPIFKNCWGHYSINIDHGLEIDLRGDDGELRFSGEFDKLVEFFTKYNIEVDYSVMESKIKEKEEELKSLKETYEKCYGDRE